jgi:hypothetical protein
VDIEEASRAPYVPYPDSLFGNRSCSEVDWEGSVLQCLSGDMEVDEITIKNGPSALQDAGSSSEFYLEEFEDFPEGQLVEVKGKLFKLGTQVVTVFVRSSPDAPNHGFVDRLI